MTGDFPILAMHDYRLHVTDGAVALRSGPGVLWRQDADQIRMFMSTPRINVILPFDSWVTTHEFSNVVRERCSFFITHFTIEMMGIGIFTSI